MHQKLDQAGAAAMEGLDLSHAGGKNGQSYDERKYRGPDNQVIDITETGWIGA